jgi:bacteriocin-like protein
MLILWEVQKMFKEMTTEEMMKVDGGQYDGSGTHYSISQKMRNIKRNLHRKVRLNVKSITGNDYLANKAADAATDKAFGDFY